MADNVYDRPGENLKALSKFLVNGGDAIHKTPNNEYMQFINAFVFLNDNLKRADAVTKGQKAWHDREHGRGEVDITLKNAVIKMEQVRNKKRTIKSFFAVQPKKTTVKQDTDVADKPKQEPVQVCVELQEVTPASAVAWKDTRQAHILDGQVCFYQQG
ncbi:uncharacterized protein LOC121391063 [Gigantopelta aegis]|uniref:uncharacterized protein LOC121391063 n=1 Tax=Gigantopelta aegis TaxID=1735272 RepID=UPI001B8891BF|nr:uncharacterized protein LOC121391063 [Gigantopelta aegis]